MSNNFEKLFNQNEEIYNHIVDLLVFLNEIFNEYNNVIVKRNRHLDFYDLFFYMLYFNSSINQTHRSSNYNFITNTKKEISENAFINRLVKLDSYYIKDINDKFINFFYKLFKIDINNIVTAVDGSNVKLLSSLNKHFKLNKNKHYTNATISCIYDVNNNFPLFMNINKSFNEVDNLLKQLDDNVIKKYQYKITVVSDRGYDCNKLINYYLKNNIFFVSRITKNNSFVNKLSKDNTNTTFTININDKSYTLRIIKYTKNELASSINEINQNINLIKNDLLKEQKKYDEYNLKNKFNNQKLQKENKTNIKKDINKIRILKSITKNKINKFKTKIDELINDKNKIKSKLNKLETYEHSDFYVITNNCKLTFDELKNIYKKRWCVETSFKFDKSVLNLNQMNNKNIKLIEQNVYIIQFIYIMNAFINKLLEKIIKKDHYLNKTQIFESLHKDIFSLLKKLLKNKKYNLRNKKVLKQKNKTKFKKNIINKLLIILKILLKYQIKKPKKERKYERIKKRINNNKFNYRNKETVD
jgi:hypothetical protein